MNDIVQQKTEFMKRKMESVNADVNDSSDSEDLDVDSFDWRTKKVVR